MADLKTLKICLTFSLVTLTVKDIVSCISFHWRSGHEATDCMVAIHH